MIEKIFLEANESDIPHEDWLAQGRPKVYKRFYADETVIAWDEIGYGGMMLKVGEVTVEGKDIVENGEYIILGYYHTGRESKIYKELKK